MSEQQELKWVKDKPTKKGFYFAYHKGEKEVGVVEVSGPVLLTKENKSELVVWVTGFECRLDLDEFSLWFGPLKVKPLPEGFKEFPRR